MPTNITLDRDPTPQRIPGTSIRITAPGLKGHLSHTGRRANARVRASAGGSPVFARELAKAGLEGAHILQIEAPTPARPKSGRTRGGAPASNEVRIEVAPADGTPVFALYQDEAGALSFHYPQRKAGGTALRRSSGRGIVIVIPLRQAKAPLQGRATRNVVGRLAKKIITIVVHKAAALVGRKLVYGAVEYWENTQRRFQGFHGGNGMADLLSAEPTPFKNFAALEGKRSLLMLHGTISSTEGAFGGLREVESTGTPPQRELDFRYPARVIGFNHHTLTKNVAQNATEFLDIFAGHPGNYEFDVITHSRGGLIVRALMHLPDDVLAKLAGRPGWKRPKDVKIVFPRVIFVATPNAGTDLADPVNLPVVLDFLANVCRLFPGVTATVLGAVFAGAAYVGGTGLKVLPGLVDQRVDATGNLSELVQALNVVDSPADPAYHGLAARWYPVGAIARGTVGRLASLIFREKDNDLVVPTDGVFRFGNGEMPADRHKRFERGTDYCHTNFFEQSHTWKAILAALPR